jgi:deoxyxylulose-5-phosphate synthase
MTLLQKINDPAELRALSRAELATLADELRTYLLESVARTGGHLSSNLGTVELTIASFGTSAIRLTRTRYSRVVAIGCLR